MCKEKERVMQRDMPEARGAIRYATPAKHNTEQTSLLEVCSYSAQRCLRHDMIENVERVCVI